MHLRNVESLLPDYKAQQSQRLPSSYLPSWQPKFSHISAIYKNTSLPPIYYHLSYFVPMCLHASIYNHCLPFNLSTFIPKQTIKLFAFICVPVADWTTFNKFHQNNVISCSIQSSITCLMKTKPVLKRVFSYKYLINLFLILQIMLLYNHPFICLFLLLYSNG